MHRGVVGVVVMTVSVAVVLVYPPKYECPDSRTADSRQRCGASPCVGQLPVSGASQATDPWLGHTGTWHNAGTGIHAISSHQCRHLLSHILVLYLEHILSLYWPFVLLIT